MIESRGGACSVSTEKNYKLMKKEALFYEKNSDGTVKCNLCPHHCSIKPNCCGVCRVRKNIDGILYSTSYGLTCSVRFDPVEKKPLYHYYPGKEILSVGGFGCNLHCVFCQNYHISQIDDLESTVCDTITPAELAKLYKKERNSCGFSFTYNEPTVNYEFIYETAKEACLQQIPVALVTNGFINQEPLKKLLPYVNALNVDVKSFSDEFYRKQTGGRLLPVLETIKTAKAQNKHIEITFLAINGLNDSPSELNNMVNWIAENVGKDTPFHISRYFPNYKLKTAPTPKNVLIQLYEIASKRLDFVYLGNVSDSEYLKTKCPSCHAVLVERNGYHSKVTGLTDRGICAKCGYSANFVL